MIYCFVCEGLQRKYEGFELIGRSRLNLKGTQHFRRDFVNSSVNAKCALIIKYYKKVFFNSTWCQPFRSTKLNNELSDWSQRGVAQIVAASRNRRIERRGRKYTTSEVSICQLITCYVTQKQRIKIAFAEGYMAANPSDGAQRSGRAMKYLKVRFF